MKFIYYYQTSIGNITIVTEDNFVVELFFGKEEKLADSLLKETPLHIDAIKQVRDYLKGELKYFNVPIKEYGTEFQKKVWAYLRTIPYGETRSYKEVAQAIDCPKGYRAVGLANNKNPISILTPCHRVIGANGQLVGYGGGLKIKRKLLEIEKKIKDYY